ncbi:amino-acid N-acetyltransferase [Saccharopolyspora sp. CA-218241]|uniref:amino-acid N-acetyltransferase n=1 Tax=Saccharopolyspora sp. CA-218241 TaxID=3240027 RepID=UPI003D96F29E
MNASVQVRPARVGDVRAIKELIDHYAGKVVLGKELVTLYEDVQEFWVAEVTEDGERRIAGCGALHVLWQDLGEIRTVAVDPTAKGLGIGTSLVERLIATAAELGLRRLFVLTFETDFFGRHGFRPISDTPVPPEVYEEIRRSPDEGVAQFLDLAHVKPNTLGNTRMLLRLS